MGRYSDDFAMGAVKRSINGYNGYLSNVSDYGVNTIANKIKHKFGQEFYISRGIAEKGTEFKKFIHEVIPDFEKKYVANDGTEILSFIEAIKLCKYTWMYICTGRYVPGKMEAAIQGDKIDSFMYIYIFGRYANKYVDKINYCMEEDRIASSSNAIYVVNKAGESFDIVSMGFDARSVDTLVYSNHEAKKATDHIDKFIKDMDFYKSKSILYKTGILLYGKPGTGKTSLVKAIASKYGRNICQINVPSMNDIDFNILKVMLEQDTDKYIVLFEDIDTIYINRDTASSTDTKDYNGIINKMLQFLDSNTSPTDVIFIATTNHVERLDEAILREGRFDIKINVKGLKEENVKDFMDLLECKYSKDYVLKTYGEPDEEGLYNQSRLQNIIVRGKEEAPEESIEEAPKKKSTRKKTTE